jgi:hypothetical protein
MCDPLSLILGGLSAAASVASSSVQANAVKKQEQANNQWMMMQQQQRRQEQARQEQLRQQAEAARGATVQDMSAENQATDQAAEQARLEAQLGGKEATSPEDAAAQNQTSVNNALLSGQASGGKEFMTELGSRVSKATADARSRIRALAAVQSFGGTQGGLQTRNALELNQGEQGINLANNLRQGSLSAFQAMQAIEPPVMKPVNNPWGGVAGALGGMVGKFGKA